MPVEIPAGAPASIGEAFARINAVSAPSVDDLKVMVLLEAAGQELYRNMAEGTDHAGVIAVLEHNGREELAHGHRVAKAIRAISGEEYLPPEAADNPYLTGPLPTAPITAEGLRGLAQGEFAGEGLYEKWAANIGNEEAAKLFRQNGKEETEHGDRLIAAAALLEA
jgi:rubrerythrin